MKRSLTTILAFLCILSGCKKSEWTELKDMKDALPYITTERVQQIAFCDKAPKGTTAYVCYEVPQSSIGKTIELIKEAENRHPQYMWEWTFMQIVTEKRKLRVLAQWDGECVSFASNISFELRKYLKEQGWKEPGESNIPIDLNSPIMILPPSPP